MSQILAIDYGKKRTGIAVTDDLQMIASGLTTVETSKLLSYLKKYLETAAVELFVVGEPKQMDNSPSESEPYIHSFLKKLKNTFPEVPIVRMDERFTSKIAFQTMIEAGISKKKRQNKALVDEISATLILQSYLSKK